MQLSQITCLGLSHQSAPVELREQMSRALLQAEPLQSAELPGRFPGLSEIVLLTTCNRIELYASIETTIPDGRQLLLDYLGAHHAAGAIQEYLYFYQGEAAVQHLLRVASGLESQVLGEPQILGQVTSAFMQAIDGRTIGPHLTTLFRGAIRTGKRARAGTAISSNPATIASAAISLAEQLLGPLQRRRALIVGLGDMGQLALNALRKRGVAQIVLANRNRARALKLARAPYELTYSLAQLPIALSAAHVVITTTSSLNFIIDSEMLAPVMAQRAAGDLVIVDIALPRDVNPDVRRLSGVHLFNMDDLHQALDEALASRRSEIPHVEAIIAGEMARLRRDFKELAVAPVIVDLRLKAEVIRQQELDRTLRHLGDDIDDHTLRHVQHLSHSLVNKLLHEPTLQLRAQASNGHAEQFAATVRRLFDLDESQAEDPSPQE